ncbi:uncharacterized protein N7459_008300 [Penicillium hispanicum]|uniref:uncharacterized protein n=1 Tax=Penicillium hispanicum TaxID=1080232 RepID=UPI002541D093|nr:uncharacterized protein N7459_008300 [Penicillium hispanicum]KAJ5573873.1 hypothetical protein N7459_008300 [Penicillium hispanicum]
MVSRELELTRRGLATYPVHASSFIHPGHQSYRSYFHKHPSVKEMEHTAESVKSAGLNCLVGTLARWNPSTGETSDPLQIYSGQEIFVGRDKRNCQCLVEDPFVSNKHLRIYTVLYDEDNPQDVPPLVYAQDLSLNGSTWNNYPMGKGKGGFLLSHGDVLQVSIGIFFQFRSTARNENCFSTLHIREMRSFEDRYVITPRVLGSGAHGRVHMAFKKNTGQQLACKMIDLQAIKSQMLKDAGEEQQSKYFSDSSSRRSEWTSALRNPEQKAKFERKMETYQREASILARLSHPNIIKLKQVIRSDDTIYIFSELVTGGDLFSYISYRGRLEENAAALIIRQVLLALEYLHDRHIVHRDLKPDNILMASLEDEARVVLTDFGCARRVEPLQRMMSLVGTLEYCAPEVKSSGKLGYTKAVDLWSLGCVTAVLLLGYTPFDDPAHDVISGLSDLEGEMIAQGIGLCAEDFLRRLLVLDETTRMDVKQALRHSWLKNSAHRGDSAEAYKRSIAH